MPAFLLRYKELVLLYAVKRNEGQQNGNGGNELLILGITAVVLVLTELQTAGTAEHNKNNSCITNKNNDPLAEAGDSADTGNENAGPEHHLAQIVGAADNAEKSGVNKALGVELLGLVLLQVCNAFKAETKEHNSSAHIGPDIGANIIEQTVVNRTDLKHIQQSTGDPNGTLYAKGNGLAVFDFCLHGAAVCSALQFSDKQIAAEADTVDYKEYAADNGSQAELISEKDEHQYAQAGNGEAVAQRDEINILIKTDGAYKQCCCQKQPDTCGECHNFVLLLKCLYGQIIVPKDKLCNKTKWNYQKKQKFSKTTNQGW